MTTTIILINLYLSETSHPLNNNNDELIKLQNLLKETMMNKSKERKNFLSRKMIILNQVRHYRFPFIPSLKPFYDFQLDKDVVTFMIMKHGQEGLQHVHESLKNDHDLNLIAISNELFVNPQKETHYRRNRNGIKQLILNEKNSLLHNNLDFDVLHDEEICRFALRFNPLSIYNVFNQTVLNDKKLMLNIVSQYGLALQFVGKSLKNDREVVLTAWTENENSIRYAGNDLLSNDNYIALLSSLNKKCNQMEIRIQIPEFRRNLPFFMNSNNTLQDLYNQIVNICYPTFYMTLNGINVIPFENMEKTLKEMEIDENTMLLVTY